VVGRLADPGVFHVVVRRTLEEAAGPLGNNLFDLAVVHGTAGAALTAVVAQLRRRHATLPLLAVAGEGVPPAEGQSAYGAGADVVLQLPLDAAVFTAVCQRLVRPAGEPPVPAPAPAATTPLPAEPEAGFAIPALEVLRNFSKVLSYSLDDRQFVQHFLLKLREIIGVNRIALFVEPAPQGSGALHPATRTTRLACIGSTGIAQDVAECFELSQAAGLGRRVAASGQIVRFRPDSALAQQHEDPRIVREFQVLGGQVAIPVNDRERCLGVAILGGKLTGERFSSEELSLLCHLMEELGLAIKNSRLHAQLTASHRLFSDVLETTTSGLLVINAELEIVHANRACREFLGGARDPAPLPAFGDLSTRIATAVCELAEHGRATAPFLAELPARTGQVFRVSLLPFARDVRKLPQPVMAIIEDFTAIEAAKRADIESANLKLTALIARRFAHEIRNSLVPLTTHQQLFDAEYASEEFRLSLKNALTVETSRIQRFTEQMLFLSHPQNPPAEIGPLEALLREAFAQAQALLNRTGQLEVAGPEDPPLVKFHRPSLLHALKEIFLNALQSAGNGAQIKVGLALQERGGEHWLEAAFRDSGPGFTAAALPHATEPFFTTRNTGVGLGLTVAQKVLQDHRGRLELRDRSGPDGPDLVLSFPQDF